MHVEDDDGIRYVTFNRPDVKNAMTAATASRLADTIGDVEAETHDAVVITGAGDTFSAGGDIEAMAERSETPREARQRVRQTLGRAAENVLAASVPVIAKVNGDAVGAGLSLVAAADFAYAADRARFAASFINVGLVPDMGGTVTLPRIVGLRKAKELAFTGDLIDAAEAAKLDLVNEAVPQDRLDDTVADLLKTLAARPTESLALTKQAFHENVGQPWSRGLEAEASLQSIAYGTDAHATGVSAFLDGHPPDFD